MQLCLLALAIVVLFFALGAVCLLRHMHVLDHEQIRPRLENLEYAEGCAGGYAVYVRGYLAAEAGGGARGAAGDKAEGSFDCGGGGGGVFVSSSIRGDGRGGRAAGDDGR